MLHLKLIITENATSNVKELKNRTAKDITDLTPALLCHVWEENKRNYTSTPPILLNCWYLVTQRDNFTLTFNFIGRK
jgi:hypothetical protein